jgi:hypothetical protein
MRPQGTPFGGRAGDAEFASCALDRRDEVVDWDRGSVST